MCCNRDAFESLTRLPNDKKIYMGDGSEVLAYGVGTVYLCPNVLLQEVLYVPDFTVNLCSVSKLAKSGFAISFEATECAIAKDGQEVVRGTGVAGLYTLKLSDEHDSEVALTATTVSLWHRRLGHLNMASVKKLATMANGVRFAEEPKTQKVCSPCVEGKQHRVFNRHEPSVRMTKRLQMIHSDTCGPFRTPSKAGAKTFVLFIDDMTRMVWCFFMKSKTETPEAFKSFKALVEKHSGQSIMRFRCDNGKAEYDNATFQTILRESGISYEPSAPYTQNQNGVSERMNRTVLEKARTMLLEAHLPESFWAEAVNTAVYLHNRSPTRSLDGITPYEAWNGTKPDLSHIKVFGCDAYLFVPDEKRGKLQAKSQKCIHMGYVWNTTKMWRLWDTTGRRVVVGSNVKFDEHSVGGSECPKLIQEVVEVFNDEPERDAVAPDETIAVDDGSKGRLHVGEHVGEHVVASEPRREASLEDEREQSVIVVPRHSQADMRVEEPATLRRSTRMRVQTKLFPGMRAFAARIGKDGEPVTFTEALAEEPVKWRHAIADELKSHMDNGTWRQATLPPGKRALSTKWVFKFKTNADGSRRYKARLVVRGFEQREGIDFEETFAPVAKFTTVRILLALAAHFDWDIEQMDVKTAFLYPEIEEEVYIAMPEGYKMFYPEDNNAEGVARLVKTLYGLRQSPLAWFKVLDRLFRSKGLMRSNEDPSLYISEDLIILIFVDDIVFFSKNKERIRDAKVWLSQAFEMVDLGELKLFLGMQIFRDRAKRSLFVSQKRYICKVLERCNMENCHGCKTPMDTKLVLTKPEEATVVGTVEYQSLVGSVMYAMLGSRPDLAYAVSTLSKFNSCPAAEHHAAAKRVLRYLQETKEYGLFYHGQEDAAFPEPVCYTDSDWAGDIESRRSTGGYVFIIGGAAVSLKTKKQTTISLSSTEAEYIALSEATKEAMWMKRLLREIESRRVPKAEVNLTEYHEEETIRLWQPWKDDSWETSTTDDELVTSRPQKILADNQGCIKLAENVFGSSRAKHIEIRYHYVRDMWEQGKIDVLYEPTATMTADVLTKALPKDRHWLHVEHMGVRTRKATEQVGAHV
jgi:transposase InsO family protein